MSPVLLRAAARGATLVLTFYVLVACSGSIRVDPDGGVVVAPDPVVIAPDGRDGRRRSPRAYDIPPGHYPPPGSCRIWYPDLPPGQQPPPSACGARVPPRAVLVRG